MKKRVIIIGGGIGGLGAAMLLAANGHDVQIFEKSARPGGCCQPHICQDFTINMGADFLSSPTILQEIFTKAGKDISNKINFLPLEPVTRYFDKGKAHFDYSQNPELMLAQINAINPQDAEGYLELGRQSRSMLRTNYWELASKPFLSLNDSLNLKSDLVRMKTLPHVMEFTAQFIQDDFLRQVFSFHPLMLGGDPRRMTYFHPYNPLLSEQAPAYYPVGGVTAIINQFLESLKEMKVEITCQAEVAEILIKNYKVNGVRLMDGSMLQADIVISNADVLCTYQNLLPKTYRQPLLNRKLYADEFTSSLFVLGLVTDCKFPNSALIHHNVMLGEDIWGFSDDIFSKLRLSKDLVFTMHIPTHLDQTLAAEEHEIIKIIAPVPNQASGLDWKTLSFSFRTRIVDYLEANFLPDLGEHIIYETYADPYSFENKFNYHLGAAYSLQPDTDHSFFNRPCNRDTRIANLYLVGSGTHPGAGINGVLNSAKIAADLIIG